MTNYEYWKDELLKIWKSGSNFGVIYNTPKACRDVCNCNRCEIFNQVQGGCFNCRKNWLDADTRVFETDWSKVPIDTPIKVIRRNKLFSRHYAGLNKCGLPTFYVNGRTSYTNSEDPCEIYDEIMLASEPDKCKYRKEAE